MDKNKGFREEKFPTHYENFLTVEADREWNGLPWEGVTFPGFERPQGYGWFMLRFERKQQNSVKQLSANNK